MWDFFCSLKLTIVTLILLAVTSIIGTVIQQGKSPQEYMQLYGEKMYRLFDTLDFFDMYHSWWFVSLLGIFAMNLICCSIKRLPKVMKIVNEPNLTPDDPFYRSLSNVDEIVTEHSIEDVRGKVSEFLSGNFAKPVVSEDGEKIHFFSQKAPYARFGVYVTHMSLLIILLGAIIGVWFGYKAYVNVPEGQVVDQVWPRTGREPIKLDFQVRCDDFTVTYYPGSTRPKDFTSDLVVLENGTEILKKTIEVNDPLTYKGITFYQSSYGPAVDKIYRFRVEERATGEVAEVTGKEGGHIEIPGGNRLIPMQHVDNFRNFGPAAQVNIDKGTDGQHQHGTPFVVMQNYPQFDAKRGGEYIVTLLGVEQSFYTGLQVAKDPGVWVVWLGCALLVVGSMIAFFLSHRRLWVTLRPVGDKVGIMVAGNAHRNQPAFAIWFDEFRDKLKEELSR
ncbi:MAG: cytochrome c biogenesis protein ResB [Desulfuromonas sp.]|nr:MAG: cytochrome c biogenesis protein ResB [Desulfuromonas sp.]